MSIC